MSFIPYNYIEKTIDVSNLTYEELRTLENKVKERIIELEHAQYEGLVNGVINAINAIIEAGYGHMDACYDDEGESYDWKGLSYEIQQEYKRRKEDY